MAVDFYKRTYYFLIPGSDISLSLHDSGGGFHLYILTCTFICVMPASTVIIQQGLRGLPDFLYMVYIVVPSPRQGLTEHVIYL